MRPKEDSWLAELRESIDDIAEVSQEVGIKGAARSRTPAPESGVTGSVQPTSSAWDRVFSNLEMLEVKTRQVWCQSG